MQTQQELQTNAPQTSSSTRTRAAAATAAP